MTLVLVPSDRLAKNEQFLGWLREHEVDPSLCYKVEIEGGKMTVYNYSINADGRKYVEEGSGEVAEDSPVTVNLKRDLPDIELSGGSS